VGPSRAQSQAATASNTRRTLTDSVEPGLGIAAVVVEPTAEPAVETPPRKKTFLRKAAAGVTAEKATPEGEEREG